MDLEEEEDVLVGVEVALFFGIAVFCRAAATIDDDDDGRGRAAAELLLLLLLLPASRRCDDDVDASVCLIAREGDRKQFPARE